MSASVAHQIAQISQVKKLCRFVVFQSNLAQQTWVDGNATKAHRRASLAPVQEHAMFVDVGCWSHSIPSKVKLDVVHISLCKVVAFLFFVSPSLSLRHANGGYCILGFESVNVCFFFLFTASQRLIQPQLPPPPPSAAPGRPWSRSASARAGGCPQSAAPARRPRSRS